MRSLILIGLTLLSLLFFGFWFLNRAPDRIRTETQALEDQAMSSEFEVQIDWEKEVSGQPVESRLRLDGILRQLERENGEKRTEWVGFDVLRVRGETRETDDLLRSPPVISRSDEVWGTFDFPVEFPDEWIQTEALILQYLLLPDDMREKGGSRQERDQAGVYTATYEKKIEGHRDVIIKRWDSYSDGGTRLDEDARTLRYVLNANGQLESVRGLIQTYANQETERVQITVDIRRLGPSPASMDDELEGERILKSSEALFPDQTESKPLSESEGGSDKDRSAPKRGPGHPENAD